MAISIKALRSIKAIADDLRGDPAIRAVARQKLEEYCGTLNYVHPPGYYSDLSNWTEHRQKHARLGQIIGESRSYTLDFYLFQIRVFEINAREWHRKSKDAPWEKRANIWDWDMFGLDGRRLINDIEGRLLKNFNLGLRLQAIFQDAVEEPKTVQDIMGEIEHCMRFEKLEERLKERAIYEKRYQIQAAQWELEKARREQGRRMPVQDAAEKLKWAQGLKGPEEDEWFDEGA